LSKPLSYNHRRLWKQLLNPDYEQQTDYVKRLGHWPSFWTKQ